MTAVARMAIEDWPMLVADLLLSGPPLQGVTPSIPTIDDFSSIFPSGSTKVPRGLCQKIAIVSDDLVVGWTGSYLSAREVINELRRQAAVQRFTYESLERHLDSLNPSIWADIGLVGFIRDPDQRIAQFGRNYSRLDTKLFGTVGLLGSGLDDFKEFLQEMQKLPEADNHIMNALEQSVGFGLHMSGSLLSIEFANSASLKKFYGGGYEIAVSERGKFKKIDDITYAFWWAQVDGSNLRGGLVPSRAFRYSYKDDLLRIRSFAIDNSGPQARGRDQLLLVPPVYREVRADEEADTTRPTLNARWLCNYCLVSFANGQGGILTKIDYKQQQEQQLVRFEDVAGGVNVTVSPEFLEDLGHRVLRGFGIVDN